MTEEKKEILCVRIKSETRTKLNEIAEKKERKTTELARMILENYTKMH